MRQKLNFVAFFFACVKLSIQKNKEIIYNNNNIAIIIGLKGFR